MKYSLVSVKNNEKHRRYVSKGIYIKKEETLFHNATFKT